MIPLENIENAYERIKNVVYKTPFAYAPNLSRKVGNEIFFTPKVKTKINFF